MDIGGYSDTVIDHFMCPRNCGTMPDADGEGNFGDPGCGDFLTVYIKVRGELITGVTFMVFGCAAAIAAGSMTTVLAEGKMMEDALRITDRQIADALGGLPEQKVHCSVLGAGALRNAVEDCRRKRTCGTERT